MTKERKEILKYLEDEGSPKRSAEIAEALRKNNNTVRGLLSKMVKAGQVYQPNRGLYTFHKQHKQKEQAQQRKQHKQLHLFPVKN
jgi:DNA-binding IclR family transcriptional regulator